MRVSELISTIANSTSYPFVPAKYLKESIRGLVKDRELALYRGEICRPEEVDLAKSEEIVKSLKIGSETQDIRDSDYVPKKDFAEELLEAAEKKRTDRIAQKILEVLGDKNYAEISYVESAIPDLSRKDIVDTARRSPRLELYSREISLIKKLEDGVEVSEDEAEEILSRFGRDDGDFIFKSEYVEEIKKRLMITTPSPPLPPPVPEIEEVDVRDLIKKFDELRGRKVKLLRIFGRCSELKEDSLSLSGAVSFLNLTGKVKVDVRGSVVFRCGSGVEKVGVISEILKKITELNGNSEYSIELGTNAEINDDFRIFAEEITSTKSKKLFWVE